MASASPSGASAPSSAASASGSSSSSSTAASDSGSASGSASQITAGSTYDTVFSSKLAVATLTDGEDDSVTVDDDYCTYNATETASSGCKQPRGCRACLRVAGCMVDSTAQCVSNSIHYNESLDFRGSLLYDNNSLGVRASLDYWNSSGAFSAAAQHWIFPSTAVDYCESNDKVCEICRLSVFSGRDNATSGDMTFCVGKSGCVCTALCDSAYHDQQLYAARVCDPSKAPSKPLPQALMWVIGAGISIVLCGLLYWWMWRRTGGGDDETDESRMDIVFSKDCRADKPGVSSHASLTESVGQRPYNLDTPVMELSMSEYPRFSPPSTRRQGPLVVGLQGELES